MIVYLELDFLKSRNKIRKHAEKYNEKVQRKHPDAFRSKIVKSNHLRTAEMILEYFYSFLKLQAKSKPLQTYRFKINSSALATSCKYNKRTAYNHIERLLEAGIFVEKLFLGSNTGYSVEFNPELLVAKSNYNFQQLLLAKYAERFKTAEIPEEVMKKVKNVSLSFSKAPSGFMKVLPHITTRTLQGLNINMGEKGIVDNDNCTADKTDKHQNSVITNDCLIQGQRQGHGMHLNANEAAFPKTQEHLQKTNRNIARRKAAHAAMHFLEAVMYPDSYVSEHDIDVSLLHLEKYFEKAKTEKQLTQLFNEFIQRVMLTRKFILKAPGRFIPNPRVWLDPAFKDGFVGTESWLKQVNKKREENAEYYGNLKILAGVYKQFILQPSLENYLSGRQTLVKKKNPEYLELFDRAVVNRVPQITKIHKQMTSNN